MSTEDPGIPLQTEKFEQSELSYKLQLVKTLALIRETPVRLNLTKQVFEWQINFWVQYQSHNLCISCCALVRCLQGLCSAMFVRKISEDFRYGEGVYRED